MKKVIIESDFELTEKQYSTVPFLIKELHCKLEDTKIGMAWVSRLERYKCFIVENKTGYKIIFNKLESR